MKPGTLFRAFFVIVIALALALPPASTAQGATRIVTSNADMGPGSLRDAILYAVNGDTITFSKDMTITLSSQLVVKKAITITGAGHHVKISGGNATRVFSVPSGGYSAGFPAFDQLTITNGAVYSYGCPNSSGSCGGGMLVDSLAGATITNSAFIGNYAGTGGALYAYESTVNVTNTTFINNTGSLNGGAIHCLTCTMTLTNDTFFDNRARDFGSAILNTRGTITLRNNLIIKGETSADMCANDMTYDTIDGGGNVHWGDWSCPGTDADPLVGAPGDYGGAVPTLPLLPGSEAFHAAYDCPENDARGVARATPCSSGAYESQGFSLAITGGNNQTTPIQRSFAEPLAVSVTPTHPGDPVDGGTVTFDAPASGASLTHTTSTASISGGTATQVLVIANAIAGGPYNVTAGGNGITGVSFALTNTCVDATTVENTAGSGAGSLRQAIANVCPGGTITFDPSLAGQTITLTTPLEVDKDLTLTGPAAGPGVTISGNHAARVFDLSGSRAIFLANLTIRDGAAIPAKPGSAGGAGVYISTSTSVRMENMTLTGNSADGGQNGGAVLVEGNASLIVANSTVSGNSATGEGGGIYNRGSMIVLNSTITNNVSAGQGGGLYSEPNNLAKLQNSILAGNTGAGGAAADCAATAIPIESQGYNLIGTTANCAFTASGTDRTGFDFASLRLGPLQNNGGPTATHALLADSPAIEFIPGCNGWSQPDQRGISRPQGPNCDAGAFEVVDNDPPDTVLDIHPDDPTPSDRALFAFSGDDGSGSGVRRFECRLDGEEFSTCEGSKEYTSLQPGSHTFQVRAVDNLENVDPTPASFTWRILLKFYLPLVRW